MSEKLLEKIPSLDLADFLSGDPARKQKFVDDLGEAYQNIGFIALRNHGLSDELSAQLYANIKKFFALPDDVKQKYENPELAGQRGYIGKGKEHAKGRNTAHYETEFSKEIKEGHHVVLSFLSRSYHESLKHAAAHDLRTITIGKPKTANDFDVAGQHMFYSRPKGEYKGPKETQKVMLDFYLVNTTLSPEGNKVKATINESTFMIDRWLPYIIEGLPMGETSLKLELVDAAGNVIPGKFNTVERSITLKPE